MKQSSRGHSGLAQGREWDGDFLASLACWSSLLIRSNLVAAMAVEHCNDLFSADIKLYSQDEFIRLLSSFSVFLFLLEKFELFLVLNSIPTRRSGMTKWWFPKPFISSYRKLFELWTIQKNQRMQMKIIARDW